MPAIPTGAPITLANEAIKLLLLVADKRIKDLSQFPKEAIYLRILLLMNSFSRNLAIK